MEKTIPKSDYAFTSYEKFVICILAIVQFTVVLDFMVLSPLGAIVMPALKITTSQFGLVVSAYAFSAGASGLLAAGFADSFDRKKLLLFFYTGFIIGTFFCAMADSYQYLLIARVVTGIFGGVMSSIGFAIITDLFKLEVRGRVMGFTQMAFAASQVLGIPVGLVLANNFGWQSPFMLIAVLSAIVALITAVNLKPVDAHLKIKSEKNPFQHLLKTLVNKRYIVGFSGTILLAIGGYMLMPFGSAFSVHNLGITKEELPYVYVVTGLISMVCGPLIGKYSDKAGKYKVFVYGSLLSIVTILIYTNLGTSPLWLVTMVNAILFAGVTARIITSAALTSGIPKLQDRGAFMSINSSIQQISGGIGSAIAGTIVVQTSTKLENYDILGYVSVLGACITMVLLYYVHRIIQGDHKVGASQSALVSK
jgi:predicted MFS family arabinose efflux permease